MSNVKKAVRFVWEMEVPETIIKELEEEALLGENGDDLITKVMEEAAKAIGPGVKIQFTGGPSLTAALKARVQK